MLARFFTWMFLERPAKDQTAAALAASLETSGQALQQRLQTMAQTPQNHKVVTHIIGIEKWAQARLKVVQGAAFRDEEYTGYRPPQNTSWDDLRAMLEQTRRETVTLARSLTPAQMDQKIRHNMFGDVSVRGWLQYILSHGNREIKGTR